MINIQILQGRVKLVFMYVGSTCECSRRAVTAVRLPCFLNVFAYFKYKLDFS